MKRIPAPFHEATEAAQSIIRMEQLEAKFEEIFGKEFPKQNQNTKEEKK